MSLHFMLDGAHKLKHKRNNDNNPTVVGRHTTIVEQCFYLERFLHIYTFSAPFYALHIPHISLLWVPVATENREGVVGVKADRPGCARFPWPIHNPLLHP